MTQHFGNRSAGPSYHGCATGQGFDHHETKRLGPIDRKQQGQGVAQEVVLLPLRNLANELDIGSFKQWLDLIVEIFLINRIYLGGDLKRNSRATGDLDSQVGAFFRRYATEKSQMIFGYGRSHAFSAIATTYPPDSDTVRQARGYGAITFRISLPQAL